MKRQKNGNFLRGAALLAAGTLLVKLAGALFKIPLKHAVGEYGMGLFNVAYSLYGPVFSLATAGFPVAVARMTSEYRSLGRWEDARQVRRVALPLFLGLGGAGALLLTLAAPLYCRLALGDFYALAPVLALAPAMLFSSWGAVLRGVTEGRGEMGPTALSQVAEALCKLGLGLFLARWAVAAGSREYAARGTVFSFAAGDPDRARMLILSFGAAGAVLGVTVGTLAGAALLAVREALRGDRDPRGGPAALPRRETARKLLGITGPIALGAVAANLAGLIDATLLQGRLATLLERDPQGLLAGLGADAAWLEEVGPQGAPTFLYGCFSLAMTLYLLAPSLTQAVGVSALPAVTAAWARQDRAALEERISSACRGTALVCFPLGLGMSAVAVPLVEVLYGADAAAPITAGILEVLGFAALGAGLCGPLSSLLQAVGRADLPVKLLAAAMLLKTALTWGLCGIPALGPRGAALATAVSYALLAAGEFRALGRAAGVPLRAGALLGKPLLAAALCAAAARAVFLLAEGRLPQGAALAAEVAAGAFFYGLGLILLGAVEKTDLNLLPGGQKIAKTLEKWGWICYDTPCSGFSATEMPAKIRGTKMRKEREPQKYHFGGKIT